MTKPYDCQLILALPASLEEEILDHLGEHPEWVTGMSLLHAEGVGSGARLRTSMEQVRGRARRRMILLLMQQKDVPPLLESLRAVFATPEIAWWSTPVTGFGRFA